MSTKVIRIETDAYDILRKYGPEPASFTDCVREMERRILGKPLPGQMSFTTASSLAQTGSAQVSSAWYPSLEDGQTPEYWARMRKEIEVVVKSYAGGTE